MSVSIDQIKDLRDRTGVSISACKQALEEAEGDFEKAVEVLRKKGEAKAAARAERGTNHSAVAVKVEGGKGAIVELECETDFVAMDGSFLELAESIADKLLKGEIKPDDRDLPEIKEAGLRLGENIQIGNMALIEGDNIGEYVHSNRKIGVLVSLKGGNDNLGKDIAMHVAATAPQVVSPDEVDDSLVSKEKEIWAEQLKSEGKPEEIIGKIMMGKERKFREENALVKQDFVKNPEKTIEDLLKEAEAEVLSFVRFG